MATRRQPDPGEDGAVRIRFRDGDEEAFAALVVPVLDDLYTFCLRIAGPRGDAWDLAHDTLLQARRKRGTFDPERPLRPWLLTLAHNLYRSRARSPWRRLRRSFEWLAALSGAPSPAEVVESAEVDAKVREALLHLPPIYREAIALHHLEGMTYDEMSFVLGVGIGALKQRVRRGNARLAAVVADRYPELGGSSPTPVGPPAPGPGRGSRR